jgi:hypothetical protein
VKITADTITAAQILECEPSAYECLTCLGVGKIRDSETGDLRRCLDCGGSGQRPDARERCAAIYNLTKLNAVTITDGQIRELMSSSDREIRKLCEIALRDPNECKTRGALLMRARRSGQARARLAEILNDRSSS